MGGAPAVIVYSRMSLLGLREIDTEKQTWTGDLYWEFLFAFVKPAFSGTPEQRARAEVVEDALAAPADITSKHPFALVFWPVLCHTDGGSPHIDVWVRAARGDVRESVLKAGGFAPAHYNVVSFSMRCTTSIYQRFQLALFPFDDQILRTRIVLAQEHSLFVFAAGAEAERVFLADGGGVKRFIIAVNGASSPVLGEWELVGNALAVACLSSRDSSRTKKQYAVLKTLILVHRHWAHHITHFYIPAFTILLLSWLTFKLDGKSRDNRTGVLGGLIFSVLSLKTQVSGILPRLGESTILDVFLWYVFFYVSSIALVIYITKASAWVLPVFSTRAINMYWLLPQSLFNSVCGVPPPPRTRRGTSPLPPWMRTWMIARKSSLCGLALRGSCAIFSAFCARTALSTPASSSSTGTLGWRAGAFLAAGAGRCACTCQTIWSWMSCSPASHGP